jgi:hypothetical protein
VRRGAEYLDGPRFAAGFGAARPACECCRFFGGIDVCMPVARWMLSQRNGCGRGRTVRATPSVPARNRASGVPTFAMSCRPPPAARIECSIGRAPLYNVRTVVATVIR